MPRTSASTAAGPTGTKRKYLSNYNNNNSQKNPKRGGAGVLLTCETGREKKCRQEAIDILNHYYRMEVRNNKNNNNNKQVDGNDDHDDDDESNGKDGNDDETPLTLEEEIKQLQTKKKEKQIFSVYETGVRGTISLLCTLPEAILVAPFAFNKATYQPPKRSNDKDDTVTGLDDPEPTSKKQKLGEDEDEEEELQVVGRTESVSTTLLVVPTPSQESSQSHPVPFRWDPVRTVRRILHDLRQGSIDAPSSRFVTRMIPIQVSCFTNDDEISHCARELFAMTTNRIQTTTTTTTKTTTTTTTTTTTQKEQQQLLQDANDKQDDVITFAIQVKRRICSHLKSKNVIELVAKEAPTTWKVNLSHPRFTVVVEICKTLCGMSIVEHLHEYGNFNLLETREQGTAAAADRTKSESHDETE